MTEKHLIFRWVEDPGRMLLETRGIVLSPQRRTLLECELRGRYNRLIGDLQRGGGAVVVSLDACARFKDFPKRFTVRCEDPTSGRNPTLILTPLPAAKGSPTTAPSPAAEEHAASAAANESAKSQSADDVPQVEEPAGPAGLIVVGGCPWVNAMLRDLEVVLAARASAQLSKEDQGRLLKVLQEFHVVCRQCDESLAVVLLAGYVAYCERYSSTINPADARFYAQAAASLSCLFGGQESLDEDVRSASSDGAYPQGKRLRRISDLIMRLVGLDDIG